MIKGYVTPELDKGAFTCINCDVYSLHGWSHSKISSNGYITGGEYQKIGGINTACCKHCGYISYWLDDKLIFPLCSNISLPNEDMPEDIKNIYNEARDIFSLSPKGSSALLRLALQKLCNNLASVKDTNNLNDTIGILVQNGLPKEIQQAMDIVRVIGNEAVHPGTIDLDDNIEIARKLFELLNFIVDKMITQPKELEEIYKSLPNEKLKSIEDRNKK